MTFSSVWSGHSGQFRVFLCLQTGSCSHPMRAWFDPLSLLSNFNDGHWLLFVLLRFHPRLVLTRWRSAHCHHSHPTANHNHNQHSMYSRPHGHHGVYDPAHSRPSLKDLCIHIFNLTYSILEPATCIFHALLFGLGSTIPIQLRFLFSTVYSSRRARSYHFLEHSCILSLTGSVPSVRSFPPRCHAYIAEELPTHRSSSCLRISYFTHVSWPVALN